MTSLAAASTDTEGLRSVCQRSTAVFRCQQATAVLPDANTATSVFHFQQGPAVAANAAPADLSGPPRACKYTAGFRCHQGLAITPKTHKSTTVLGCQRDSYALLPARPRHHSIPLIIILQKKKKKMVGGRLGEERIIKRKREGGGVRAYKRAIYGSVSRPQ